MAGLTTATAGGQTFVFVADGASKQVEGDVLTPSTGTLAPMPGSPVTLFGIDNGTGGLYAPPGSGFVTAIPCCGYSNYMEDFSYNGGQLAAGHFMEMDQMANDPTQQATVGNILLVANALGSISLCDLGPVGGLDYCITGGTVQHSGGVVHGIGVD